MVRRPRNTVAPPAVLSGNRAVNERQRAEDYYRATVDLQPNFDRFVIYGDEEVREALRQLFQNKCAYCESLFVNHKVQVEHYRPKGRVDLERSGPWNIGYWWLASDWTNLLPTCSDCNIAAYHTMPDGSSKILGKGNYFPLRAGQSCARSIYLLDNEDPLLIDPTKDYPHRYLKFSMEGKRGRPESVVRAIPCPVGDAQGYSKAETSIDGYGLNRRLLVIARTKTMKLLEFALNNWEAQLEVLQDIDNVQVREKYAVKARATFHELLKLYVAPESPYSQACYSYIKVWLKSHSLLPETMLAQPAQVFA
jgi:uncharacterized protein (TIGR02646 family)